MLVVLDTNVLVSGLLKTTGNPSRIIDLVINNQIQLAYDDRILGEYEDVLSRKELNISQAQAKAGISYIELTGQFIEIDTPFSSEGLPDLNDLPFIEVFITSNAKALVTGNLRHFTALVNEGLIVMTPSQFIEKFFPNQ